MADQTQVIRIVVDATGAENGSRRVKRSLEDVNSTAKATAYQMAQLQPQLNDIFTQLASGTSVFTVMVQQGPQITQIFGGITNTLRMIPAPLAAAAAGLAVIGAGFAAYSRHVESIRAVDNANRLMGNGLGLTRAGLEGMADAAASAGRISVTTARELQTIYTGAGKIGGDVMQRLIGLTRDYAVATGQEAADAAKELAGLMKDPAKGAAELADKFNLLSGAELTHIQQLEAMGRHQEAQTELIGKLTPRIKDAADNVDYWSRKWNALKTAGSDALDAVGRKLDELEKGPPAATRIANLQDQLNALRSGQQPGDNDAARRIRDAELRNRGITPPTAAADESAVAGQLYDEIANSAAEVWTAIGQGVAATNREASRTAEAVVRSYSSTDEQIRKVTEDIAKLNKGLGPDMSDAARQAGTALTAVLGAREAALESAQGQGISLDTVKTTQMLAFQRQAVGMTPLQRERFLAERGAQVGNIGSTEQDPEQAARVNNALTGVLIAQQTAAADAVRELGLQADAAERLAEAAGKGEAAQRRANIENAVAAAELKGLGIETRVAMEAIEEATKKQIRADATKGLADQIRLQTALADAYGKGPAAVQQVQLAEQARTLALKEATKGTQEYADAYAYYLGLLGKGADAERNAKIGDQFKQNGDALTLARTELGLTGKNEDERARILGHLKAEMDLRRQFPGIADDDLRKLVAQSDQLLVINQQARREQAVWDDLGNTLSRSFDRVGDAVTEAFAQGNAAAINFGGIAKGVVASLFSDLMKLAIVNPIKNGLFGQNNPTLSDVGGLIGRMLGNSSVTAPGAVAVSSGVQVTATGATAGAGYIGGLYGQFHSGGIVGGSAVMRSADPAIFLGATRYHSGGIAGLEPDEVPAILRRNEEVLTANDPRHRWNAAPANQSAPVVNVVVNNNAPGTDTRQNVTQGADGSINIELIVDKITAKQASRNGSATSKALQSTYGARQQLIAR